LDLLWAKKGTWEIFSFFVFYFFFIFACLFFFKHNKHHSLPTTQPQHQVESGLLLNIVIGKSATILELLASENETLLVGRNAFLVLNLGLDVVNGVRGFNFKGDGLAGEGLDEDLHATTETEDEVKSGLLLDVVVRESATVLKLLAGENETLLIGRNAFLVLDLGLDVVNGVRGFNLKSNGLASQGLDENLHGVVVEEEVVRKAGGLSEGCQKRTEEKEGRKLLDGLVVLNG